MPILQLVRFLAQSAVFISLSAASMVCLVVLLYGKAPGWLAAAIPFMFTFVVYNFDRLVDLDFEANPERSQALRRSRAWLGALMASCLVGVVVLAFLQGVDTLALVLAFPIASALYVLPVLPFRKARRLKDIPYLKSFYVPATWCILVPLALQLSGSSWNEGPWVFVLTFLYLRVFVGATIGDLRDIRGDLAAGVPTLAVRLGEDASYRMVGILNVVSLALPVFAVAQGESPALLALIPACLVAMGITRAFRLQPERRELLADAYDLEYLSYFPLLLVAHRFFL